MQRGTTIDPFTDALGSYLAYEERELLEPLARVRAGRARAPRVVGATSVQLQGVKAGERAAVVLHEETVAQGSEVDRGEAQRVDERGHYGAGLGVLTGREDASRPRHAAGSAG